MIDLILLREHPEQVIANIQKKRSSVSYRAVA